MILTYQIKAIAAMPHGLNLNSSVNRLLNACEAPPAWACLRTILFDVFRITRSFGAAHPMNLADQPKRFESPKSLYVSMIALIFEARVSIANGFVIICMPGSKNPAAMAAFSA